MSGNINQPTEVVQRIVNVEKVPSKVVDDPSPVLAGDLNASGKNIKNVDVLEAKSINCGSLVDWVTGMAGGAMEFAKKNCAPVEHKHEIEDVNGLAQFVGSIVDAHDATCSKVGHRHRAQDVDGMKEIVEFIVSEMGYAKEGHSHGEMDRRIETLAKEINKRASVADVNLLIQKIAEATKVLSERINSVNEKVGAVDSRVTSIPKPEKVKVKPEEIFLKVISAEKVLIGERCNGLTIKEIVGVDMDGARIIVDSSKPVGAKVSKDEVLTIKCPKVALVRILLND